MPAVRPFSAVFFTAGFFGRCRAVASGASFSCRIPVFTVLTGPAVRCTGALPVSGGEGEFDSLARRFCSFLIGLVTDMKCEAVKVDRIGTAGETGDIGVSGQHPLGALFDFHIDTACRSVAVDGACKDGTLLQIQIQFRYIIHDHVAVDLLLCRGHIHMASVGAFAAPAGCCRSEENTVTLVDDLRIRQVDGCSGVVDKENISVCVCETASVHGKGSGTLIRVTGHGLVDHDSLIVVGLITVLGVIVRGQFHVIEGDGILTFYNNALRGGGLHLSIADGDIGGGIDDR